MIPVHSVSEPLTPSASGTFARTPLANLLVYCLDRKLTGTLVLESPDGLRHAIYFREGAPAKAKSGDAFAHLGRVLVEMGAIDERTHDESLAHVETRGALHGQILVEDGKIDRTTLLRGLREQVARKVAHLAELPDDTHFGFYDDKNLLEAWGGPDLTPAEPLALVWLAVRAKPTDPRVRATLAKLGDGPLKLHVQGDFRRFELGPRVRGVVELLKVKPCTRAQLHDGGVATENDVDLALYTFLITRHLDLGPASGKPPVGFDGEASAPDSKPPDSSRNPEARALGRVKLKSMLQPAPKSGAVEVPPAPPPREASESSPIIEELLGVKATPKPAEPAPSSSPELDARRAEIRERAEKIDKEEYFTMLGIPRDASVEAAQSAYFQLAKRWHPDRLPSELADVRDLAAKVFSRVTEAFQTLNDADRRKKYVELLKNGGGTPEEQARVTSLLEAQMDFQKAEILLKKGDGQGAYRFASRAAQKDPEQPDYLALLAWLRATQAGAPQEAVRPAIADLDRVLSGDPNHQRALWYRGTLLKRISEMDRAIVDFRKLVELDPKHVDATREIRLYQMRKGEGPTEKKEKPKPDSGDKRDLFGKLFKK